MGRRRVDSQYSLMNALKKKVRRALIMAGCSEKRCFGAPANVCYSEDALAVDRDRACVVCRAFYEFMLEVRRGEHRD